MAGLGPGCESREVHKLRKLRRCLLSGLCNRPWRQKDQGQVIQCTHIIKCAQELCLRFVTPVIRRVGGLVIQPGRPGDGIGFAGGNRNIVSCNVKFFCGKTRFVFLI